MAVPSSTYRLQIRPSFDLHAAADVCDYVATLGAGAVYLSPLLPSAPGSEHGYDVIGFDRVDPARGGADGWTRLVAAARSRGLKIVVDIVPNHTGVASPPDNPAWWDVLRLGAASPFAAWFDIEWTRGRLLLPVLGDDFDPSQLQVIDGELRYFEHRFPIAPGTGPAAGSGPAADAGGAADPGDAADPGGVGRTNGDSGETAADVHDRQHYELVNFRRAATEQNYRRFFAVVTLAGLRVEDDAVFDGTHAEIGRWLRGSGAPTITGGTAGGDGIDGVRVDHPDGLADPLAYLSRLRELAGPDVWITVEKILEPGESLPTEWPVDGTTGYDALAEVDGLFVDPAAESALDETYRELTGDDRDYAEHVAAGKRNAVDTILRAEVSRLARLAPGVEHAEEALAELLVAFPVYRSYLPTGAEYLASAIEQARSNRPELGDAIGMLATRLGDPADELCSRFQQTSGAVMAKGVEDTAYYCYTRFIAGNEVGSDPARFGLSPAAFHEAQRRRQREAPRSMTTLSTHDTKRGEDVRARLAVLSELPGEWTSLARGLMKAAPLPDRGFAYLLWQTFVGSGGISAGDGVAGDGRLIDRDRMHAYAEKAMREAAVSTNWIDPDTRFEAAVHSLVDRAYDDPAVRDPLAAFTQRITPYGWTNSLSQKLVQLTMPGVPDVYQGTARWGDSLVDPDNRRPVDFDAARARLDELDADVHPPPIDASGAAKLWLVSRTLRLRRDWPELFDSYTPLQARGAASEHVVAFDRGRVLTVATRLPVGLERAGGWRDTTLDLEARATDAISGTSFDAGPIALAELLATYPVALLLH
ncbi:MAG: malto-oligosyltrehalose synthase [Jatrophihabitantaceae bacterium]